MQATEDHQKTLSDFTDGGCLIREMQNHPDAQLLRQYAVQRSEAAFSEIVARHAGLVYAAALRQLDSADLARDVAQSVFADLARKAPSLADKLSADASLAGWLYRSTRFAARDRVRHDRRRQARERQVMQHFNATTETAPEWEQVRPVLDEAMAELSEEDREALLLRYFEKQDLQAVGLALGISADAAQKRVSRALERLHTGLTSRGVTTTAGALSALLLAETVSFAPAGLAATLSTAALAGTTLTMATTATVTKAIAMTTMQKTVIAATLVAAVVTGIYEARQVSRLRSRIQLHQQQQAPLADQIQQLQRERDYATNRMALLAGELAKMKSDSAELLRLRGEMARLRQNADPANDPIQTAAKSWLIRVAQLRQRLEQMPEGKIPELELLEEKDWLEAVKDGDLDSDNAYRRALGRLRTAAKRKFGSDAHSALLKFIKANDDKFPTDLAQLAQYLATPVDDAILQRWAIVPAAKTVGHLELWGRDWVITEKAPVDTLFDSRFGIGRLGYGGGDYLQSEISETMLPVYKAFAKENAGEQGYYTSDPSRLLPYATTADQKTAIQKLIERAVK